ncbi:alanine:cation symporter family protein [Lentibacillus amyloliquefaciens]|uniref:alanine:cation symporter family protein n=1 Tax=Lentibacillus amyloliquefaciens TaxID=1472767 RepID=UPI003AACF5D8
MKCFYEPDKGLNPTAVKAYRTVFVLFIFVGATVPLDVIWTLADVLNGLMAAPNLIGLLGLSGVIVYETKRFQKKAKEESKKAS